jgi:hypothetical protein
MIAWFCAIGVAAGALAAGAPPCLPPLAPVANVIVPGVRAVALRPGYSNDLQSLIDDGARALKPRLMVRPWLSQGDSVAPSSNSFEVVHAR